jgi:hypothetical protein
MSSLQEQIDAESPWPLRGKYVVYFVSWVAFSGLTLLLFFRMPNLLKLLMAVFEVNRWARSAVHNFSFVILGLIGLSFVIIIENYLRTAVLKNLLARRVAISVGSAIVLLGASIALHGFLVSVLLR